MKHDVRDLLHAAASALEDECEAAGEDEVAEDPNLRGHAEIAARIRVYLRARPRARGGILLERQVLKLVRQRVRAAQGDDGRASAIEVFVFPRGKGKTPGWSTMWRDLPPGDAAIPTDAEIAGRAPRAEPLIEEARRRVRRRA